MRVKSSNEYVIEVNDDGDTIVLDPTDSTLTTKLLKAFERIDALAKDFEARAREIAAREDAPVNEFITQNEMDAIALANEFYTPARLALDGFLGTGACQKIFGDKNWLTMFEDLTIAFEPHLKAIGVNVERLKTSAALKHAPNREARRALK
jgi:hypothetical protein